MTVAWDRFTCKRCGALLARVELVTGSRALVVVPGLRQVTSFAWRKVTVTCGCGLVRTIDAPKSVVTVVGEGRAA